LYDAGLSNSFKKVKYWYYFDDAYPENFKKPCKVKELNLGKELLESDVVLLLASTSSLAKLGWGFIDQTYDLLIKDVDRELAIRKIIISIKSDPKWLDSVRKKAAARNIELDSMLRLDAEYVYQMKK
jgi:hypothetical protein